MKGSTKEDTGPLSPPPSPPKPLLSLQKRFYLPKFINKQHKEQ